MSYNCQQWVFITHKFTKVHLKRYTLYVHTRNSNHEDKTKKDVGSVRHKHSKLSYFGVIVEIVERRGTRDCCIGLWIVQGYDFGRS